MDRWLKTGTLLKRKAESSSDSDNGELMRSSSKEFKKTPLRKTRKYSEEYLAFGFTKTFVDNIELPICLVCHETLANESMKPANLRRHLETKHKEFINKSIDFFQLKLKELQASQKLFKQATGCNNKQAVIASYQVALLVAKSGKPHTIAENLIYPAAKAMVTTMLGEKVWKSLSSISLSNDSVKHRISDMSVNIKKQLIDRIINSRYYSLQLDESTDVSNNAAFLTFIRYEFDGKIHEDILFCQSLPTRTTSLALFTCLNEFVEANKMDWSKCCGITTDGARAMTGVLNGLISLVKAKAPNIMTIHCCLHRESLAARKMPAELETTFNEIIKVVNYIKARPLNSRVFKVLCEEMGSEHKQLLLHSEVRWLSRGRVLSRIFELRDEVELFFRNDEKFHLKDRFHDFYWLAKLAYLADIFCVLNELNLSLQGTTINIFKVQDKVEAIMKKFDLWGKRLQNRVFESFPKLFELTEASQVILPDNVVKVFITHLANLKESFRCYFPPPNSDYNWIRDPFNCENIHEIKTLTILEQDKLTELSCDTSVKLAFKDNCLPDFWLLLNNIYPELSEKATKYLLPFCTTYLCEKSFSMMTYIKNKYRNKLDVEPDLRINISNIMPEISDIVDKKQHHPSHCK